MKTVIDTHVALESRYYGSQDGTAVAVAVASTTVNNASATVQSFARVIANGDLRWSIGDAAPDVNGDGQELLLDGDTLLVEVPASPLAPVSGFAYGSHGAPPQRSQWHRRPYGLTLYGWFGERRCMTAKGSEPVSGYGSAYWAIWKGILNVD